VKIDPCLPREHEVLDQLRGVVVDLKARQRAIATRVADLEDQVSVLAGQPGLPEVANQLDAWREALHQASHAVGDPTSLDGVMGELRLNVAFVGRTEAGKSTLINALMRNTEAEVGNGHQRTTRQIATYRYTDLITIVDTPGVAAADGAEDEALAQAAAHRSDFLVYVISNDQFGGEEARVLSGLDDVTTPCVLVLNVKEDIDGHRKGRDLRAKRRLFIASPDTVFVPRDLEDHAARIAEAAPRLWQRAGCQILPLHALAATMAAEPRFEAEAAALLRNSRLEHLEDKLDEAARRLISGSRVVQVTGPFSKGAFHSDRLLADLQSKMEGAREGLASTSLRMMQQVDAIVRFHEDSFRYRVGRALDSVRSEIPAIVEAETSHGIHRRWERTFESANLEDEFRESLERLSEEIGEALSSPIPLQEGIEWRPPAIVFDLRIDMTDIVVEALLDGVKGAGIRGLTKAAAKLILKRGSQSAATGGPIGAAVIVLVWVASVARRVQLGRHRAQRKLRLELTRTVRLVLDGTESRLPQQFRRAVSGGNLGGSIDRRRRDLEWSVAVLDELLAELGEAREELALIGDAWLTEQLRHLDGLWGAPNGEWSLRTIRDGELWVRTDGAIPWAGVVAMEKLTGVKFVLHESLLTCDQQYREAHGEEVHDAGARHLGHAGTQLAAATGGS